MKKSLDFAKVPSCFEASVYYVVQGIVDEAQILDDVHRLLVDVFLRNIFAPYILVVYASNIREYLGTHEFKWPFAGICAAAT